MAFIKRMKAQKTKTFGKRSVHEGNESQKEEGQREKWRSSSKRKRKYILTH
ncbi:hypothetical protein [Niallia circulans]|uniref:hypothetical protein n=1 Tax=Niallia circulans TaxID=1397 RepID=UPI00352570B3